MTAVIGKANRLNFTPATDTYVSYKEFDELWLKVNLGKPSATSQSHRCLSCSLAAYYTRNWEMVRNVTMHIMSENTHAITRSSSGLVASELAVLAIL